MTTTTFVAGAAVVYGVIQLATAVIALVGVLQGRQHGKSLEKIDVQTNHTNEVLQAANAASHADMTALATRLVDAKEDRGPENA